MVAEKKMTDAEVLHYVEETMKLYDEYLTHYRAGQIEEYKAIYEYSNLDVDFSPGAFTRKEFCRPCIALQPSSS